jgi:fumarate hydratase class II
LRYRIESDALGKVRVPYDAYYGSETARAISNFNISGVKIYPEFIRSYAILKKAAALANFSEGRLSISRCRAIAKACDEICSGRLSDQFQVDIFQAGAGTSTNMNLNEVIANRAIELLGGRKGDYSIVHPNDHVNMSQSTNDTFHAAMRISAYIALKNDLLPALKALSGELGSKSKSFMSIVKTGRTHLQDAVPIRLGQEFSGYRGLVEESISSLKKSRDGLAALPLGGTAVGTGMGASPGYREKVISELGKLTGVRFRASTHLFADMQGESGELELSNSISEAAVSLGKIANDIRLLGSGPGAGLGELILPAVQPGSSIMPGKVNPSIAEMLNMVCFQAIGCSEAVKEAASAGQLELNVFMPVMAFNLLFSMRILSNAVSTFAQLCIKGIMPDTKRIKQNLESDLSIVTALSRKIGYSAAARIARKAYLNNMSIKAVCIAEGILSEKEAEKLLDPASMV